jgi:hypothetical protein
MRLIALLIATTSLGTAACSSSTGGNTGSSSSSGGTGSSSGSSGPVSFSADVLPAFQMSCGIAGSTCHGTGLNASIMQRPFLGNNTGGTDPSMVLPGIVSVTSQEDPKLDIVKPGDSANSYMVYKIKGTQGMLKTDCATGGTPYTDCGLQMPYASAPLDQATIDLIIRWIDQGAQNN